MAKEKNVEYQNIKLEEVLKKLQEERNKILEEFAKAYLAETGLNPSEVELVTTQESTGPIIETIYYFRKKNG